MSAKITIDSSQLAAMEAEIMARCEEARQPVQTAMGEMFYAITRSNIGDFGLDRPTEWVPLSPSYARKVKRQHATLFVSGRLENAILMDTSSPDFAKVSINDSDVPYASAHQWGNGNLPARPYFPIRNGEATPFTRAQVLAAAEIELRKVL